MPLPELMVSAASEHFDRDGNLIDSDVRTSLGDLLEALGAFGRPLCFPARRLFGRERLSICYRHRASTGQLLGH